MEGSVSSVQSESLLCIVEDNSEGEALAGTDWADAVAHGYSIDAAGAALGSVIDGEDDGFALMEWDDGDA